MKIVNECLQLKLKSIFHIIKKCFEHNIVLMERTILL
jgi:hypothetical protein